MTKKISTNSWQARECLMDREAFDTHGALMATSHDLNHPAPELPYSNRLPEEWRRRYAADQHRITYIVWSYCTPIAWVVDCVEVVTVDHKWSVTTSKHQGMLYALGELTQDQRAGIREAAQRERDRSRQRGWGQQFR